MPTRVLAVDPSLRASGFAVVEESRDGVRTLEFGVIRTGDSPLPQALKQIFDTLGDAITRWEPGALAIESTIYVQSHKTAIVLGAARGAALLAAATHGLPVHEYAPRKVKQAVVGRGGAAKTQVAFMVRALAGLTETPPPDAADAIAVALTHFHAATNRHVHSGS